MIEKNYTHSGYCLHWRNKGLNVHANAVRQLEVAELEAANLKLIQLVQREHFSKEINTLRSGGSQVVATSKIVRLRPFIDEKGVLRASGRLKYAADLNVFQRHPIMLPNNSLYTRLLFKDEHEKQCHTGPQVLVASIRLQYWPLGARNIARQTIHRCITCFKVKPVTVQPIMGDLSRERVTCSRLFSRCRIDFAGPIMIRTSFVERLLVRRGTFVFL